jgi:tetratricopeptide (TPR) repeat protein
LGFLVLPSATRYAALAVALGFSIGLPALAIAADRYYDADAKAARGDAAAAEAAYDKLLKKTPYDTRALNGRATARAWASKHDAAQSDYRAVLARDPNNLQALTGIGYSYAWNKQYTDAERSFKAALALAPDNAGATKGLGYTYLWSGRHTDARKVFEDASARWPNDAEIKTALAQAQPVAAVKETPQAAPRRMWGELHVWAGTTSNGDAGLRSVEAAYWPQDDWRLALRYDNSLSLDNPALARTGADAETYYASVLHQFNEHWQGLARRCIWTARTCTS